MEIKWIKIQTDIFSNEKIKYILSAENGAAFFITWIRLLTMAGKINDGGYIYLTKKIPFTAETLAKSIGNDAETTSAALQLFTDLNMIRVDKNGILVLNWEEYQNIEALEKLREQSRKSSQKYREKRKECHGDVTVTDNVTQGDAIEEEREEERDKDKEIHSFNHSRTREEEIAEDRIEKGRKYFAGTSVMLSDDQLGDLLERITLEEFHHYVDVIDAAEKSGHHYKRKTHYDAILEMTEKDRGLKNG